MDISLREWLIIGGVLIVILILVDGWRRVSANRSRLKLEIDRTLSELGDSDGHNPELPNGGARRCQGQAPEEVPERETASARPAVKERREPSLGQRREPSLDAAPELTEMDPLFDDIPTREEAARGRAKPRAKPKQDTRKPAPAQPVVQAPEPAPEPLFDNLGPADASAGDDRELMDAVDRGDLQGSSLEMDYPLKEEPLPVKSEQSQVPDDDQHELDLDQPIPTLFDQIGADLPNDTLAAYRDSVERETERVEAAEAEQERPSHSAEPAVAAEPDLDFTPEAPEPQRSAAASTESQPRQPVQSVEQPSEPEPAEPVEETPAPAKPKGPTRSSMPDPEHVLVITVVGRNGERLPGPVLGKIVDACGMDWGDMSIYHRAEDSSPNSPIQFSMANAVPPGTFDPDNMDALETPAVSFFMSMSEPKDPMTAYECMLATAETLAKHLNGELLDEDRSVMRPQTKEHYRERIREFQMHQRQRRVN